VPVRIDPNLTLDKAALREMIASGNPDLLFAQRSLNVQYLQTKELKGAILPEISLFTGYNYAHSEAEAGFTLGRTADGISYGIRSTMNIFDGFNRTREIQNAKILLETTDLQIENLRLELNAELEKAYMNYQNSIDLITLERENLGVARENAEIGLERYRLGNSNALELREAQRNAVQAESRLIDAVFNTKIAEIELMRLTGQMVDSAP
jgi:outer membrane protein TolC